MLRAAGSRFRSTGAPKMSGNSSNQGHHTPSAVVKCKFPLSELRGEATYYTHRAVAGSRFPGTMPLHLKESFAVFHDKTGVVVLDRDSTRSEPVEIRRVCCFLNALHAPRCGGKQI